MTIDDDILRMIRQWMPFGGPPPDEVWVRFGMNSNKFYTLADAIAARRPTDVTAAEVQFIKVIQKDWSRDGPP
jgi:hypothetical protein